MKSRENIAKNLPVVLTPEERTDYAVKLARLLGDLDDHAKSEAEAKAALKAARERLEKERNAVARVLREGQVHKRIVCRWRMNDETEKWELVRDDTGEAIEVDEVSDDDRQQLLFDEARADGVEVELGDLVMVEAGVRGEVREIARSEDDGWSVCVMVAGEGGEDPVLIWIAADRLTRNEAEDVDFLVRQPEQNGETEEEPERQKEPPILFDDEPAEEEGETEDADEEGGDE